MKKDVSRETCRKMFHVKQIDPASSGSFRFLLTALFRFFFGNGFSFSSLDAI